MVKMLNDKRRETWCKLRQLMRELKDCKENSIGDANWQNFRP